MRSAVFKNLVTATGIAMIAMALLLVITALSPIWRMGEAFPPATKIELWIGGLVCLAAGIYCIAYRDRGASFHLTSFKIVMFNLVIGVVACEIALRAFFSQELYIREQGAQYWRHDVEVGWSRRPLIAGEFSNGYFRGVFHTDEDGNRLNSPDGTRVPGYQNIFMIGDSVTASLEVNDNDTVSAILETELRKVGHQVNVINLGVRGYGTDQAVRKALLFAKKYEPKEIIYTFVSNDIPDNNVIRKNKFGKGIYYRRHDDKRFITHNYPVGEFSDYERGVVVLDDDCRPVVVEDEDIKPIHANEKPWYYKSFYSMRARKKIKDAVNDLFAEEDATKGDGLTVAQEAGTPTVDAHPGLSTERVTRDPYHLLQLDKHVIHKQGFWRSWRRAYEPGGITRVRCQSYFEDQLSFLVLLLRSIPSVERIHVVSHGIPGRDQSTLKDHPDMKALQRLKREGVIDTLIVLPAKKMPPGMTAEDLYCPRDSHFCETGNRWVANELLRDISFPRRGAL